MKRGPSPEKMRDWTERLHRFEQASVTGYWPLPHHTNR